jgi:hypothetical protein
VPLSPTGRGQSQAAGNNVKVNQAFALVVLAALIILVAMRHLFGSIRVEVGAH